LVQNVRLEGAAFLDVQSGYPGLPSLPRSRPAQLGW
jgi:hypothetical protein